jgi:hypothetical protein
VADCLSRAWSCSSFHELLLIARLFCCSMDVIWELTPVGPCRSNVEGKMRRNFSASVFGPFFWLIFVGIGWAESGGTW